MHVLRLIDAATRQNHEAVGNYKLWRFIEKRFPETKVGMWRVEVSPYTVTVVQSEE